MAKIKELLKNLRVLRVFIALWNVFVVLLMIVYDFPPFEIHLIVD